MTIRNVGNSDQAYHPEEVSAQKPSPEPAAATVQPANTQTKLSTQAQTLPPARTTMNSGRLKAMLNARISGEHVKPPVISRAFQVPITNLLRNAEKLTDVTAKYQANIAHQVDQLKSNTGQFLDYARDSHTRLSDLQSQMGHLLPAEHANGLTQLIGQLSGTIKQIQSSTNDLLYDINRHSTGMANSTAQFSQAAQSFATGNANGLPAAMKAFQNLAAVPQQISDRAQDHLATTNDAIAPLMTHAKSVGSFLGGLASMIGPDLGKVFHNVVDDAKATLADMGQTLSQTAHQTLTTGSFSLKGLANELADKAYKFKYDTGQSIDGFITDWIKPLLNAAGGGLKNLFGSIIGTNDKDPHGSAVPQSQLVSGTQDLRDTIKAAQAGDQNAINKLKQQYGYTPQNAPKPGQMWLAANHVGGDLESGKVTATHFPASGKTSSVAADPNMLFANGKTITLKDVNGKETVVSSMAQYQQIVAANRAKLGMPVNDGKPQSVQLTMEGGGGKGKRYAPTLEEMYNLGIFPASVSGTSAGAITASLVAAGIDPKEIDRVEKDPALGNFFDARLGGPGLLQGKELYNYMDQELRKITGITDRPVTFADLPMPLYLTATKLSDSQAGNSMTSMQDRLFIFSKETTPDTPVAMALEASASIPGAFDPMDMVDPATGRTIRLVDGGVLDNYPVGLAHNNLPEVAIRLDSPGDTSRSRNNAGNPQPLPPGNLISNDPIGNAKLGLQLLNANDTGSQDFYKAVHPAAGVFSLSTPTWTYQNVSQGDSTFGFGYDKSIDPTLDRESFQVTDDFFKQFFGKLNDPKASGSNLKPPVGDQSFTRTFSHNGATWTASHTAGSDYVDFRSDKGDTHHLNLGKDRLASWINDDLSFGDLTNCLEFLLTDREHFAFGL